MMRKTRDVVLSLFTALFLMAGMAATAVADDR
jgi:hypothetical protein